jgi:hypothetical protein
MAREETTREDLLREATALVERVELIITDGMSGVLSRDSHIVAGFRSNGSVSFFFGDDPVYQFNSTGQLRRAYCRGLLFKAAHGRLVALERARQRNEVQLLSRQLTDAEQASFTDHMRTCLRELAETLEHGRYEVVGQVPTEKDVLQRVKNWLAEHDGTPIAASPRAM